MKDTKEKKPKIQRITYKMMYSFLCTMHENQEIDLGSMTDCLSCKTIKNNFAKDQPNFYVYAIKDYKGRETFDDLTTFAQHWQRNNRVFIVPDKFATYVGSNLKNPRQKVSLLKKTLLTLSKKTLH